MLFYFLHVGNVSFIILLWRALEFLQYNTEIDGSLSLL